MLGGAFGQAAPASALNYLETPIQHLVVIYGENISFDHYGTYPNAENPPGEPPFTPYANTPTVNGLTGALLTNNPNLVNPFRLDRSQAITCDNNNDYTAEQKAVNGGLMDKFVQNTGVSGGQCNPDTVMRYYDGTTVTATSTATGVVTQQSVTLAHEASATAYIGLVAFLIWGSARATRSGRGRSHSPRRGTRSTALFR